MRTEALLVVEGELLGAGREVIVVVLMVETVAMWMLPLGS